jgi:hypothetical protein
MSSEVIVKRIAICYPTQSLSDQVRQWSRGHDECRVESVSARSAAGIRRSLGGADLALVDASDDHEQAVELFAQAVVRLGARRATVYTEQMHDGLESFVRTQGAWLLLGPLTDEQWEDYFSTMLPPMRREDVQSRTSLRKAA